MSRLLPARHLAAVPLVLLAAGLSACASPQAGDQDGPTEDFGVVVSTTILGDIVQQLVGDDGSVEVLMQPGQDPHGFALSARQARAIRQADLVIVNGLQLEASLGDQLEAAEEDGVEVLRVAPLLDPIPFAGDGDHEDDGEVHADGEGLEHDRGSEDPHVWYDPVRMAEAARLIADRLAAVDDSLDDATWEARGEVVAADILAVHEEVASILGQIPERCRKLVTNHDSFGYLAARYGFEIVGTVVPGTSGTAEPSAQEFAELIETVRASGVPAIFAEITQSARLAETLAREVGREVQVVTLFTDSLGAPGTGAERYTGMLLTNARRIADALSSC